jgi:hypothetical protein
MFSMGYDADGHLLGYVVLGLVVLGLVVLGLTVSGLNDSCS